MACDDWTSLQELTREFTVVKLDGTKVRGQTEETLRSLLAKGLIRIAWVKHHYRGVREHGQLAPPEEQEILPQQLDEVFNDPGNWIGADFPEQSVEFTAPEEGYRCLQETFRRKAASESSES